MRIYRYSKSRGKAKKLLRLDTDSILKGISSRMLEDYNLSTAMERLKWEGLLDLHEEQIDGLARMLEQIKELKADLLKTYNFDHLLDKIKDAIKSICEKKLKSLKSERSKYNHLEQDEDIVQPFEERIKELYHRLETDFPKDLSQLLKKIIGISPPENSLREKIFHISENVWRKISGLNILIQEGYTIDYQELIVALAELKKIIEASKEETEPSFFQFMATYSHVFNFEKGLNSWIEKIQKKRVALKLLLLSLPYPVRISLEGFEGFSIEMDRLTQSLRELWACLDKISPNPNIKGYHFSGNRSLDLDSALVLAERIYKLDELENAILRANIQGNLSEINKDLLREILGELAENSLQKLSQIVDVLIEDGYLNAGEDGYRLTSKALRRIGELALLDIFSNFYWAKSNVMASRKNRPVHSFTGDTKEYEYGDILNLHLSSTIFNTLRRNPIIRPPLSINPLDFEVYKPEHISQNSTILLIDMSSSMADKFPKAKEVALALKQLIYHYFPGDNLKIVGFYTLARTINIDELIELKAIPFYVGPFPRMIGYQELKERERDGGLNFPGDFTNIQEGLRISRELLLRDKNEEKHIFLITDGEPTACIKDGTVYLECPPSSDIFEETLKEVMKCTRCGIRITTFMLSENRALQEFVKGLEKINTRKALFTPPEEIDHYVVIDYLRKKSYQIV